MNPIVLIILDGFGLGKKNQGNPVTQTVTPTLDWFKKNFPFFSLQASGIAVGLPWGDPGSSEIGHLAIGSGRINYQNHPRITLAIRNGSFFDNSILFQIKNHVAARSSKLHLIGLLSRAKTNVAIEHLEAILKFVKDNQIKNVLLHLIGDGKETPAKEISRLIEDLQKNLKENPGVKIASLSGRYYAMDSNEYWERTEKVFQMLISGEKIHQDAQTILNETFSRNLSEEFIEPCLIGTPEEKESLTIKNNDAILFFNFREEGLKQLAESMATPEFNGFARNLPQNLFLASLTEYEGKLPIKAIFKKPEVENSLTAILSQNNKRQLKLAESAKDKLLTYYFNGMVNKQFSNELRIILPSNKTEKDFRLQTEALTARLLSAMEEKVHDFIVINLANADWAGHQADFETARQTVSYLDTILNRIATASLQLKASLIITADHGNIENMFDPITGEPDMKHNDSPVPFFLIDQRFYKTKTDQEVSEDERSIRGSLADIAPTILEMMNLKKPEQMTGQGLIKFCLKT